MHLPCPGSPVVQRRLSADAVDGCCRIYLPVGTYLSVGTYLPVGTISPPAPAPGVGRHAAGEQEHLHHRSAAERLHHGAGRRLDFRGRLASDGSQPEMAADSRDELPRRERLYEIVVGADRHALDPRFFTGAR